MTQFVQKESTQQIADNKDQLSNNRARNKDSKGYEQQVLVHVSASITADRHDFAAVAERELQAASGFGADDSVNSASGVIARKLSNELEDLGGGG